MLFSAHRKNGLIASDILFKAAIGIALVSFLALAGAWAFEILGGYVPCPLCLEQRIPYYAAVPAGALAAFLARKTPLLSAIVLALITAALIYNAGLGVYHAGAEWHFWPGPDTCSSTQDISELTSGNLSKSLQHNRPVRCDEAALRIFGVSLAGYSVLISSALALAGLWALGRSKFWRSGKQGG